MRNRRKRRGRAWLSKLFVGALMWLAKKVLEPIPVLGALVDIVAFAV